MRWLLILLMLGPAAAAPPARAARPALPSVRLQRVPDHGLQPQVGVDGAGRVHLLYFTGPPSGGDLWYAVSTDGGATFAPAIQVNHRPHDAMAVGNMRGAHLVLDAREGWAGALGAPGPAERQAGGVATPRQAPRQSISAVDVAWVGAGSPAHPPMWFTRLNAAGTSFRPERNLAPPMYLDGGTLAASGKTVEVYWHGMVPPAHTEAQRRVWMARSTDGGRWFASARPISDPSTGACGCCGMAALAQARNFYVIYRSARQLVHRDLFLLHSSDGGRTFQGVDFSHWNVGYCVMSTAQLTSTPAGLLAAWEQRGHVLWAHVAPDGSVGPAHAAPVPEPATNVMDQKYPVVAADRRGDVLLAWTEGMGWRRGGSLHWQLYSSSGKPLGQPGSVPGVPMWSLVAAWARPDGNFTVMY